MPITEIVEALRRLLPGAEEELPRKMPPSFFLFLFFAFPPSSPPPY